ncbi:hypothetical protein NW760_015244 [Fusarium oxysporum]|nr:hypothetical protein NW769_015058 [Fusarium oxysporum]KAJ4118638.1 hypothetical protein NW765_017525 [Fusarium oxysporum]KAJ4212904.1 hypothetical protein NW760_015244 [Fusarium oxysporum]KAJ4263260.1 hypothetical protein NW764_016155 [Fusarium oxysporum]
MTLGPVATFKLKDIIHNACADQETGIAGTTVVVVDRNGELLLHSARKRGVATSEPMALDNVFWITFCTKMLTRVGCMQLVEQGKLRLDDRDHLESLCPELKKLKVLKKDGSIEDNNQAITLRMLLAHTAGFGYTSLMNDFEIGASQQGWMNSPAGLKMSHSLFSFNREKVGSMKLALTGLA